MDLLVRMTASVTPPEFPPRVEKLNLISAVAYALWEDRKRQQLPDDPESDWYAAERLIEDLWNYRPLQDVPGRR